MPTLANAPNRLPARKRRHDAFERSVAALRAFQKVALPEDMERIASHLEEAFLSPSIAPEREAFLVALAGEPALTEPERMEQETASIARYFQHRRQLLQDSLSAPQVARLLGTTRQTPHDRVKAGTLLAVQERGGLRFPPWQFDAQGPNGVVVGFAEVVRTLTVSSLEKVSWFVRPNPYLEQRTPLEALRTGEWERLVPIARGVGVS